MMIRRCGLLLTMEFARNIHQIKVRRIWCAGCGVHRPRRMRCFHASVHPHPAEAMPRTRFRGKACVARSRGSLGERSTSCTIGGTVAGAAWFRGTYAASSDVGTRHPPSGQRVGSVSDPLPPLSLLDNMQRAQPILFYFFPLKISLISESTSVTNTSLHSTGLSASGRCK